MLKYIVTIIFFCAAVAGARAASPEDLRNAIISGDVQKVSDALEAGLDPNEAFRPFGTPAVALAAIRGEHAILELLLAHGASPDATGFGGLNALSMAVRSCSASADDISTLLRAGVDIENAGIDGMTPIMFAIQSGRRDVAALLAAKGARLDRTNVFGDGALNLAIYARDAVFVRTSLSGGAPLGQLNVLFDTHGYRAYESDHRRSLRVAGECIT
jgi:ankyrin repeat protein